jgi:transcriptional regulator with GAF, ATPase, and Fis domain
MSERSNVDLATILADAAEAINAGGTLEDTLDTIARTARDTVPGFDDVSITVRETDGSLSTMAATSALVRELDNLQYEVGEGPCLSALKQDENVLAEHLAQESRWPRYVPGAVDAGVRAQMGVQLYSRQDSLGGLNFYSTSSATIDPEAPRRAQLFAQHAALALEHTRHAELVSAAAPTRRLVSQAVGIMMERFEITEERAMFCLVRVAAAGQLEVAEVAREVVQGVTTRAEEH